MAISNWHEQSDCEFATCILPIWVNGYCNKAARSPLRRGAQRKILKHRGSEQAERKSVQGTVRFWLFRSPDHARSTDHPIFSWFSPRLRASAVKIRLRVPSAQISGQLVVPFS